MKKSEFHSCISGDNEQNACDSHAPMFHILKALLESVILMSDM